MRADDYQAAIDWAKQLLERKNFCILDTETTGLGNTAEICQIAVTDHEGSVLLNTLVSPTVDIEPGAARIHGITQDLVEMAPPFNQVLLDLMKAIGGMDVVIFNAEYDLRLIKQSLRSYGIQLAFPTSDRRGCRIFTNGGAIHCAMLWYSQWCGEWNNYYSNYKWQKLPGGDHSALGDCIATLEVIRKMAGIMPPEQLAAREGIPF